MTTDGIHRAFEAAFEALGAPARRERMEQYRLERTAALIDRRAGGVSGKRVLELGASFGVNLAALRSLGAATATGVDFFIFPETPDNDFTVEAKAFAEVREAWKRAGIEVVRHDLSARLPFPDGAFDLVVSNAVVEHLHGIHAQVFAEALRVLAPGGRFVFTTPNLASLLKRLRFFVGRSPNWDIDDYFRQGTGFTGHVREFTVPECRRMLEAAGFRETDVFTRPGYFKWRWLHMPSKWHTLAINLAARLRPTWSDLVVAIGRKPS
jgi:SAM-dependent methyltransferase